ncbi:MAG: hypothetical protein WBE66_13455 [Mycobacterium sp.]
MTRARYVTPPEGRDTGIPKTIMADDVQRLLDSCDISDPAGVRDYANSCWSQAWACDRLRRRGCRIGRPQLAPGRGAQTPPASSTTAYSHVMNWSDPTKAYAVPRSVALRDQVHAPQGVTGESCVIEG